MIEVTDTERGQVWDLETGRGHHLAGCALARGGVDWR